ncbi:N-Acetyl-D-glucosamine ABC transport system, permease protein 2 [Euzebya pacifica]|uniref:N-Acetyl-D-glucosamine ABC transport system, permease protein 2 n=1 Tax=Euzebya pacifica TaxID=1608957 RepID=A0A346Y0D1_9ACTN|nr:N-Acetyl-D-glucosamine ABC transport system, permease protein 2 [Euzebya pacifica]
MVDRTDVDTAVADRPTTTPVRRDSRHDRVRRRRQLSSILRTALILAGALIMLFPFAWMVATSLTNESQLFGTPRLIPDPIDTTAYRRVADTFPLWRWMANSIGVAVVSTTLQVITSAMAAYAFARFEFRGKHLLFGVYLATLMIPLQVLIVPLFIEVSRLGLQDTYVALLLPLIASPFGVFLLRQFFLGLPPEIEEAARIDGAGHWQVFTRIVLPMSKPAIATLVVFAFMAAWNSFLWPLVVINSEQLMTLPLGLSQLHGRFATEWNLVMAGSTISVLPIVALYLFTQRYVIQGVALSGLKG